MPNAKQRGYNRWRTLREVRLEHGVSLRDLEAQTGVNRAVISQIERGRMNATTAELQSLGHALDVAVTTLSIAVVEVQP